MHFLDSTKKLADEQVDPKRKQGLGKRWKPVPHLELIVLAENHQHRRPDLGPRAEEVLLAERIDAVLDADAAVALSDSTLTFDAKKKTLTEAFYEQGNTTAVWSKVSV